MKVGDKVKVFNRSISGAEKFEGVAVVDSVFTCIDSAYYCAVQFEDEEEFFYRWIDKKDVV